MADSRKKLYRPKGYKPFWEKDEEEKEVEQPEPQKEEEDDKKFKLVRGLMRTGLGGAIKKKY